MTEKKASWKKRGWYGVATLLVVSILAAIIFWQKIKYQLVNRQLHTAITGKSDGLYRISYKNLTIDEVAGHVSVEDLHLSTDSVWYAALASTDSIPARIDVRIPRLVISGVKTPKALLNKEIEAHSINIDSAVIELSLEKKNTGSSGTKIAEAIYKQVLGKLQSVRADSLVLRKITFIIRDAASGQISFNGNGFSCSLSDILMDSAHQQDSSRVFFAREIALSCSNLKLNSKDKQYKYIFSGLEYRSDQNRFRAARILVEPQQPEAAFAAAHKYSIDRYHFLMEGLDIRNINRYALFSDRLLADSLVIEKSSFKIFRDISHPHDSVDRTAKYPQQSLAKLPLPLYIGVVVFRNSFIEYKEKNAKSDSSGRVQFYDVRASLTNVTNIRDRIRKNNRMRLDFHSRFLNQAAFHAEMLMLLNDPSGRFTLDAKLGGMETRYLNPMIEPMALARIDRGNIQGLAYRLEGDNHHGEGKLTFLYRDLKVVLLKKDQEKNKYKTKFLPTLAAGLFVKKANPSGGETRISRVDYPRDKYRSMFNLMWKSMFQALKETAGM